VGGIMLPTIPKNIIFRKGPSVHQQVKNVEIFRILSSDIRDLVCKTSQFSVVMKQQILFGKHVTQIGKGRKM
jgi:hypothetical protein